MDAIKPLPHRALYHPCDLADLGFATSDELAPLAANLGQKRAAGASTSTRYTMWTRRWSSWRGSPPGFPTPKAPTRSTAVNGQIQYRLSELFSVRQQITGAAKGDA